MTEISINYDPGKVFFKEVILAGTPDYFTLYCQLILSMGVKIKAVVSDTEDAPEGAISLRDYMTRRELRDVPVIVLDHVREGDSCFLEFADRIIKECIVGKRHLPPLFHSAIITGMIDGLAEGAWLNSGYPGSGNALISNILEEIYETYCRDQIKPVGPVQVMSTMLGDYMFKSMFDAFFRIVKGLDIDEYVHYVGISSWIYHIKLMLKDGTRIIIYNMPRTLFAGRHVMEHFMWTREARELYRRQGNHCFFTVRNPFDTLASNAAKTFRPLLRGIYDERFFRSAVKQYATHLRLALEGADLLTFVRYEDILSDPVKQISRIAQAQGYDLGEDSAAEIWDKLGFKPLKHVKSKTHLYKPGESKLKFFTKEQAAIMKEHGLDELSAAFGYQWPDDTMLRDEPVEYDPAEVRRTRRHGIRGRCDPELWNIYKWVDPYTGVMVTSSSEQSLAHIKRNMQLQPSTTVFFNSLNEIFGPQAVPDIYLEFINY